MKLMEFQKKAVDDLSESFFNLWKTNENKLPLVFKAPTGAGKTIMMAEFLRTLDTNYHFDEDKAYIWISFGGDESYMQSKKKLYKYFNDGTDMALKDKDDLSQKELGKNNIFFINWSKIKSSTKDGKVLRKDNELTDGDYGIFDEYIKNTKAKRDLVLIVDEAHTETSTGLATEVIDLIDPRIIIKVTATPKTTPSADDIDDNKAGYIRVKEDEVIQSGLIKDSIIIQTKEEIESIESGSLSEDELMIELAIKRRDELLGYYQDLKLDINPLVLIQLPNDMDEKEQVTTNKKAVVLNYLKSKGISNDKIAIWLSNEKINLDLIELNNSDVDFMLFKAAAATGWDCPRASILVMFREIKTPTFHTQIIGRIKRMPEAKHYENGILNKAYIYTNYNKSHIQDIKDKTENKVPCFNSVIKPEIEQIELQSMYHNRVDFNTLTPENKWQKYMLSILDENKELILERIDTTVTAIDNKIVVDTTIDSFDNFIVQLKAKANETNFHFSRNDIEKLYNLLCFEELQKQDLELAKYNPSRSWSALKKSLNVWFNKRLNLHKEKFYTIIVNDMLKSDNKSVLKQMIHKALVGFREIFEAETESKDGKEEIIVIAPPQELSFTDDYELIECNKNVYNLFYNAKKYLGKENEEKFITFLEEQDNVQWWHKQSNSGKDAFAVEYYDAQESKDRLFFPDFIIKTKDKLYILDTKKDGTAKSTETKSKSEALQKWIKENQDKYDLELIGGIAIIKHPHWKLNSQDEYIYENDSEWINIEF
ncbi:type III restriction enzyme, res subunit [Sulfurimonas gotlandica GD1]|uniref:Type III restriction enzyme, res subunit n=1 Tax=Sulfurimonas gotlandica (strain DSM 19862 / JCM 16533 / GD1) TaxID=929558 RepID=B6BM42_SULGG|nr:DEAD/DEAH box helicase family protein [Sulfurimonas gotlandica]EDZ61811.1 Type III restriction enzyme, res subunit family [Sulfurimonas gotlandica GD1]EHP29382.1 type III restriction enzyme, res subunit [Sulfurimonas gotlandica GD1]